MSTPSEQFKARGLCGWYVRMAADPDGNPMPDARAHSNSCYVITDPAMTGYPGIEVPVEEVPAGTIACGHCGGGAWKRWSAGARP